jgi:hypothetical protein
MPGWPGGAALLALALAAGGCGTAPPAKDAGCLGCHAGIEAASASHEGCVGCHGGDPSATGKTAAHAGIWGLANPSYPARWEKGCGECHRHQVDRVRTSQMYTNAGMIGQIQATWEGETPGTTYAAREAELHDLEGRPVAHRPVAQLDHISGELYRKFCSRCHVARQSPSLESNGHPAGCAACHFPYAEDGLYRGGDPTVKGKGPHGATHAMDGLPTMRACLACHQRSGRHALSYQGLMDGNNSLVPTRAGGPGPVRASDERSLTHVAADVHFLAGMECIDCHTSRELMGEGYAAADMRGQLEVRCEDCHGDGERRPVVATVGREHEAPVRESRHYALEVRPGDRVVLTSRGRPFSNVLERDGGIVVATKRAGKLLRSAVVTGTPEHRIAGHERLDCSACHSRTVVQCYGCHTQYDKRSPGWDFVKGRETEGEFSETEDVRRLYPFPLALNGRGRISPVTPGCQTFVTVIEKDGRASKEEHVALFRGRPQLRFAPFFGHNTGPRAIGCAECHGDPAFLGFGQHVVERGEIRPTLLCEKNEAKPLDGFVAMEKGRVVAHAAISRAGARPLDDREVRRALAVNLCLVCHPSARDPIYRARLDYDALEDALHRRLLAAR